VNAVAMECRPLAGSDSDAERYYLESLNVCFPNWGGREMFDWCFSRETAGLRPDLMMLHDADAGRPVAGTANTYRRIRLPNGQAMIVGIMTGSWTLPEARGRGAFTRLISESIELAAARDAGLLLGFYARTNPSAGRLRAAGSALFPSWHCRSAAERRIAEDAGTRAYVECGTDDASGDGIDGIEDRQNIADAARLIYTADEFRDQFIRRPNPVMRVRSAATVRAGAQAGSDHQQISWSALVERTPAFDRVLSLTFSTPSVPSVDAWADAIEVLDARAAAAGRRVFCYTTQPEQAEALRDRGFEIVDGYISALVANEAILRSACAAGRGERLTAAPSAEPTSELATSAASSSRSSSHALAEPASPWYLGRWFVRNGDRM
jgi:hypothetical protein